MDPQCRGPPVFVFDALKDEQLKIDAANSLLAGATNAQFGMAGAGSNHPEYDVLQMVNSQYLFLGQRPADGSFLTSPEKRPRNFGNVLVRDNHFNVQAAALRHGIVHSTSLAAKSAALTTKLTVQVTSPAGSYSVCGSTYSHQLETFDVDPIR